MFRPPKAIFRPSQLLGIFTPCCHQTTVVQNSEESGRKYWVTRSSVRSFVCTAQSLLARTAPFTLQLSFVRSLVPLTGPLTHLLSTSCESAWFDVSKRPGFFPTVQTLRNDIVIDKRNKKKYSNKEQRADGTQNYWGWDPIWQPLVHSLFTTGSSRCSTLH